MTDVAHFTCTFCPFDGDAVFTDNPELVLPLRWSCPDCGFEHAGEIEQDGYDDGMDAKYE